MKPRPEAVNKLITDSVRKRPYDHAVRIVPVNCVPSTAQAARSLASLPCETCPMRSPRACKPRVSTTMTVWRLSCPMAQKWPWPFSPSRERPHPHHSTPRTRLPFGDLVRDDLGGPAQGARKRRTAAGGVEPGAGGDWGAVRGKVCFEPRVTDAVTCTNGCFQISVCCVFQLPTERVE